jgi:hypothetical protein
MNPTKPTPSLRERLDVLASTYMLTQETPILDLLSAMIDRLEPVSNPDTLEEPCSPDSAPLGVNHQKCDRCGKPLHVHMGYYMPCVCDAADSPAGGGGTDGASLSTGSIDQTQGSGSISNNAATVPSQGNAIPTPPTPAGEIPHFCLNPSVCRLCHPPAGEGRVPVPEWCEKGLQASGRYVVAGGFQGWAVEFEPHPPHYVSTAEDTVTFTVDAINSGLTALRADRDRWREQVHELEAFVGDYRLLKHAFPTAMALNDALVASEKDLGLAEKHIAELEAAQAAQIKTIDNLTARKYPSVEQVEQWWSLWMSRKPVSTGQAWYSWLLDRAREQEGKG